MSKHVVLKDGFHNPPLKVAGADIAFIDEKGICACVNVQLPELKVIETSTIIKQLSFPYIREYLAFREADSVISAYKQLTDQPDALLVNAHGIAHPRFYGAASHIGVLLDTTTIGVTSNNLCGHYKYEPPQIGDAIICSHMGRNVGYLFQSKKNCRPVFISPGHKVSMSSTIQIIKSCMGTHKMPEPLYLAHIIANRVKQRELNSLL
jgi:deoxyribonuclease V